MGVRTNRKDRDTQDGTQRTIMNHRRHEKTNDFIFLVFLGCEHNFSKIRSPTISPEGYRFSFHCFKHFESQDGWERQGYARCNTKNYLVAILGVKPNKATYTKRLKDRKLFLEYGTGNIGE